MEAEAAGEEAVVAEKGEGEGEKEQEELAEVVAATAPDTSSMYGEKYQITASSSPNVPATPSPPAAKNTIDDNTIHISLIINPDRQHLTRPRTNNTKHLPRLPSNGAKHLTSQTGDDTRFATSATNAAAAAKGEGDDEERRRR